MATGDEIRDFLYQPGRLVLSPTNLAAVFPHGGTALGYTEEGVTVVVEQLVNELRHYASGPQPYALQDRGFEQLCLKADLMQVGDTQLGATLPSGQLSTGASTGAKVWSVTQATQYSGMRTGAVVAFSPENLDDGRVVVLWNAVGTLKRDPFLFRRRRRTLLKLELRGLPDSSGRVWTFGDRQDITIS